MRQIDTGHWKAEGPRWVVVIANQRGPVSFHPAIFPDREYYNFTSLKSYSSRLPPRLVRQISLNLRYVVQSA